MAGISKKKSKKMQDYAMSRVQIRPLPDAVEESISRAMEEFDFPDRHEAFLFLGRMGVLHGIDVGGEMLNEAEVRAELIEKFGCHWETARNHVHKAARRKRHPDYQWDQRGGRREGAGKPRKYIIEVTHGRAVVSQHVRVGKEFMYSAAANWEDLEFQAGLMVQAQGATLELSGHYECPDFLVGQADWDTEEE
jgi:hypothetical protein